MVERTGRLLLLRAKMEDATADSVLAVFSAKQNSIVAPLRQSLTCHQGKEMPQHQQLAAAIGKVISTTPAVDAAYAALSVGPSNAATGNKNIQRITYEANAYNR